MTITEPIDYLSLRPVDVETPTHRYIRFRFLYVGGAAQLIPANGEAVSVTPGTVVRTQNRQWTFTPADQSGDWIIEDDLTGCACKGSRIETL